MNEQVQVVTQLHRDVDAVILPIGLWDASEDVLAAVAEIGQQKAAEVTVARDSGILVVGEEEFRAWLWVAAE